LLISTKSRNQVKNSAATGFCRICQQEAHLLQRNNVSAMHCVVTHLLSTTITETCITKTLRPLNWQMYYTQRIKLSYANMDKACVMQVVELKHRRLMPPFHRTMQISMQTSHYQKLESLACIFAVIIYEYLCLHAVVSERHKTMTLDILVQKPNLMQDGYSRSIKYRQSLTYSAPDPKSPLGHGSYHKNKLAVKCHL